MDRFYLLNNEQRFVAIEHTLRTVRRLTACVSKAQTREERSRHARHARLFLADARRVSRRIRREPIDKGARTGWIRTPEHYALDRSIEAAMLWLDRATSKARRAGR